MGACKTITRGAGFVFFLLITGHATAGESRFSQLNGNLIYGKDVDTVRPIASITKLMTAMVVLDAKLDLEETLTITEADRDLIRQTGSRLGFGASLPRREMLLLALMSSENRAATALGRTYPFITQSSTTTDMEVRPYTNRGPLTYANTNRLLKNKNWDIELSKTGYLNEAGRCLVMQANS